ncbi:hydrogenase maturation nickel metallochaperone HypA/HybF [Magnetococcales bacterium HHB-1]
MHELSLAMALIQQVIDRLEEEKATACSITVEIGPLSGVDREAFEFCFPLAAENTALKDVQLIIDEVPLTLHCDACHNDFNRKTIHLCCPHCHSNRVRITKGDGFYLKTMEIIPCARTVDATLKRD